MSPRLKDILSRAYGAQVLSVGTLGDAMERFTESAKDPAFLKEAEAEYNRAKQFSKERCFISFQYAIFLKAALGAKNAAS